MALEGPWVVTGAGGSEGAARVLVSLLTEAGLCARYEAPSAFAVEPVSGGTLVAFSQQLSPNGRLALAAASRFRQVVLFTSPTAALGAPCRALADTGVRVVAHAPAEEGGLLLRVVGPAVQLTLALRMAERLAALSGHAFSWGEAWGRLDEALARAADHARRSPLRAGAFEGAIGLVAIGRQGERAAGLRQKLVEGLGRCDAWDALGMVHGSLQGFYPYRATLLALFDGASVRERDLIERLESVIDPERHQVVPLPSMLPGPLALLEHDAALNALLVRALALHPRDLACWPGQGRDRPLYDLDETFAAG